MTGGANLRYKKTELKRLIQLARDDGGYQPDPNRWPRSGTLAGGVVMIFFDDNEDAPGWWRPASRVG